MGSGPPCQATWNVDVVFSGVVRSIENIEEPGPNFTLPTNVVRFEVEGAFRGATAGPIEVLTPSSGAACGYGFKVGKRYVVYARKNAFSRLTTSICSRTRPIEEAAEDLKYLSSIPATAAGARIFGRVKQVEWDPGKEVSVDYGPMEGLTVELRGPGFVRQTSTDENGRYEISGVPPGKIAIELFAPPEFYQLGLRRDLDVKDARACAQVDYIVHWEARIAGSVIDSDGRPVAGVTVEAIAAELLKTSQRRYLYGRSQTKTDASGSFLIENLPPASYVVAVRLVEVPPPGAREIHTYAPGTTIAEKATVVAVEAGETKQIAPIRLLPSSRR
jgi:hypothetical protein